MTYGKKVKYLIFIETNPEIAAYEGMYFTDCSATNSLVRLTETFI